jgi:hypothetical protein
MPPLRLEFEIDTYAHDPGFWGASLANNAEFLFGTLDAAGVKSIAEVGAYAGDLTRLLLRWAEPRGGRVVAIDNDPQPQLAQLADERSDLDLIRGTSLEALAAMEPTEAVILDGDHNWYTVHEELELIARRADGGPLPLLLFHDVGWPHARRDLYYDADRIPEEFRHPSAPGGGLQPGNPGIVAGALPMPGASARHEGGPRNGVLTAIEDFVAEHDGLRLAVVPSFFGFGVLWPLDAPYTDAVAAFIDPWDGNPVLARLEENRVRHIVGAQLARSEAMGWENRDRQKEALLRKLLVSKSFDLAQAISRLRQRGEPAFSKDEIRALLEG